MGEKPRLTLLGAASLQATNGGRLLTARRHISMLAFLSLHEASRVPRELLSGILWSETDDARARASLRQCLTELRADPLVGESLIVDRQSVSLDRTKIAVDVQELLDAALRRDVRVLQAIPEGFADQILYGFEDVGPAFAEWLGETRRRLRAQVLEAIEKVLSDRSIDAGTRIKLARLILRIEPLHENACRFAMLALAEAGDIGQALSLYGEFYQRLDDELGMEPSAATQEVAVEIKQGRFDQAQPIPARSETHVLHGQPLLAVLPMEIFGRDQQLEDLGGMLVEDLVCKIATLPDFPVLSNASTRVIGIDPDPISKLRNKHGVNYVLRGSLRRVGGTFRVTVQLIDANSQLVSSAQSFDSSENDLLRLQTTIVDRVVRRIVPSVHSIESNMLGQFGSMRLSAYQKLLHARRLIYSLEKEKLDEAATLLSRTIEEEPDFLNLHLTLADLYSLRIGQRWSSDPGADMARLRQSIGKALTLHPQNSRALAIHGHNIGIYERAYDEALSEFSAALGAMPNDAETLLWSSPGMAYTGHHEQAIDCAERAVALSPEDPLLFRAHHFLSIAHFAAGEFDEAARFGLASRERNPRYTSNLRITIGALVALGRVAEARELAQEFLDLHPDFRVSDFIRWQAFRDAQKREDFGHLLLRAGLPA